jgi:hypothetical protein
MASHNRHAHVTYVVVIEVCFEAAADVREWRVESVGVSRWEASTIARRGRLACMRKDCGGGYNFMSEKLASIRWALAFSEASCLLSVSEGRLAVSEGRDGK